MIWLFIWLVSAYLTMGFYIADQPLVEEVTTKGLVISGLLGPFGTVTAVFVVDKFKVDLTWFNKVRFIG